MKNENGSVRRSCLVDIGLIRMDRYPMNPSTLSLIDYLREGGEVPSIKIAKHPKGGYIIRDGRHRILAYKLLGRTKIKAKFSDKAILPNKSRKDSNKMNLKTNDILQTPEYIWQPLGPFDLDPCAGEITEIGKVNWWDGRGENGLEREWKEFVWCNPPFSQKELWAEKMIKHNNGILILPERGSAPWFGPLAESVGVYFVMGKKINFIGSPSSNNLGSILFPFGSEAVNRIENSDLPGHLVNVRWFKPRCA